MHTAQLLRAEMFAVQIDGKASNRETLLDWQVQDRLGIVVTAPLGAIGASLMIQLAITAYYDKLPDRRHSPHYPELYIFNVGGRYGDHSTMDVRPARKQLFLSEPKALVGAVNAHAITHLLVPDGAICDIGYTYLESEAASERIRHCFAYDSTGRVRTPDITIEARDSAVNFDTANTIDPNRVLAFETEWLEIGDTAQRADTAQWFIEFKSRIGEVTEANRVAMARQRAVISRDGLPTETYRRITVAEALGFGRSIPAT
jgi:hypothetical protein